MSTHIQRFGSILVASSELVVWPIARRFTRADTPSQAGIDDLLKYLACLGPQLLVERFRARSLSRRRARQQAQANARRARIMAASPTTGEAILGHQTALAQSSELAMRLLDVGHAPNSPEYVAVLRQAREALRAMLELGASLPPGTEDAEVTAALIGSIAALEALDLYD